VTTTPLRQAYLDFSEGRVDAAREACRELLARAPEHAGALHLLGLIAHQAGDRAGSESMLRRAANAPDATTFHWLTFAQLCRDLIDDREAIAAARRAVELDESSVLAWFCLGNLLREAREFEQSADCFARAIRCDPAFWQARANLALVRARLGAQAEGIAELRRLRREQPVNAELRGNFAGLLQELGHFAEAESEARSAAVLEPAVLEHHLRVAEIEMQRGRHSMALAGLAAIEARWPDDHRLLTLKVHGLRHLDQNEAALALCRDALAKGIDAPDLLRAYGLAAQSAGQELLALELFDRAAGASAAARTAALALSDKGLLLTELGRTADAVSVLSLAVERDPALADARYNRANAKRHEPHDPDIAAMERLLDTHVPYRDGLLLHFALGKAYFDAGKIDEAFRHWHEGNRMKRASIDYDAAEASRQLSAIAARPVEFARGPLTESRLSELPIFIVGMPRSGSTLVEQILAAHPDIHGGGELLQLRGLFEAGLTAAPGAQPTAPSARGATQDDALDRLADAALARLRRASIGALRVTDKDLANFQHLGFIHRVFPQARIIHCRRDPLESCFSAYTRLFFGSFGFVYQMDELGRYYRDYDALMTHWRSALPRRAFMEIDYEALVSQPEAETRRLLDFVGLAWNDRCLRFFESGRTVSTSSAAQVRRPIYRSSLHRTDPLRARLQPLIVALGDLVPQGIAPGAAPGALGAGP
jgi:tetratricopeptide (TPR) repeat protein